MANDGQRRAEVDERRATPALADGSASRLPFRSPALVGRHVSLRPLMADDVNALRLVELAGTGFARWRFRGGTPSPDQWAQAVWQGVLAQFVVVVNPPRPDASARPLGLVLVYNANFQDGHAHLAVMSFEPGRREPLLILGLALFIEYVFTCWSFRKLYFEVAEYNLVQFRQGLERFCVVEGRLRGHIAYGGSLWDEVILALYRTRWEAEAGDTLAIAKMPVSRTAEIRYPRLRT